MRRCWIPILLLVVAGCGRDPVEDLAKRAERQREAAQLLDRLGEPAVVDRVVALGEVDPVLQATGSGYPLLVRCGACAALGRLGGAEARARLDELAQDKNEEDWVVRFARAALAGEPAPFDQVKRAAEAERRLEEPLRRTDIAPLVALGVAGPFLRATESGPNRAIACLALGGIGGIGGEKARARLEEIASDMTVAHELRLHAIEGLRLLDEPGTLEATFERIDRRMELEREGMEYAAILANPDAVDQVVKLGAVWVLIDATRPEKPQRMRHQAAVGLGRVGGREARDRLLELVMNNEGDVPVDGPMRLYAAVGLTLLKDPGTAVDLLLALSRINPNDNIGALAEEGRSGPYYTIDAQLCDALLGLGVWGAEDELLEQMRRRHYIRVLIDAHAVLRRRTGLELPFRYNGSYDDRDADVAAWEKALLASRAQRYAEHPLDGSDPRLRRRLQDMLDWLGGRSVNNRYIARKVVERIGPDAVGALLAMLGGHNHVGQREAALMLGLIGDPAAAGGLHAALGLEDAHARANVVDALRRLGGGLAETHGAVRALLADDDPGVRAAAARYLAARGDQADVERLQAALAVETAPSTRATVLIALLRLGDKSVIPALEQVAAKGEQLDRDAAAAALAEERGK